MKKEELSILFDCESHVTPFLVKYVSFDGFLLVAQRAIVFDETEAFLTYCNTLKRAKNINIVADWRTDLKIHPDLYYHFYNTVKALKLDHIWPGIVDYLQGCSRKYGRETKTPARRNFEF